MIPNPGAPSAALDPEPIGEGVCDRHRDTWGAAYARTLGGRTSTRGPAYLVLTIAARIVSVVSFRFFMTVLWWVLIRAAASSR